MAPEGSSSASAGGAAAASEGSSSASAGGQPERRRRARAPKRCPSCGPARGEMNLVQAVRCSSTADRRAQGTLCLTEGTAPNLNPAAGYQFRLVSYNILAQVYVKSTFFPHSPSACLKWKSRSKAVLTELKSFDADLMCIQELDEYDTFYKKNMENSGYSSIYIQRSGDKRDGCGIFYKPKSAELVQKEGIHYNDLVEKYVPSDHVNSALENNSSTEDKKAKPDNSKRGDPDDPRVRLKRDCVGLLAAFKLSDPCDHILIVANTHIYWDPEWIDVKLAQANYLLSRVSKFEQLIANKYNCKPSVIIAGDFNSTPGDKVYNYLVSANLESTDEAPIKLRSLYAANGGEPEYTNYTPGFTGTLDYIFLSDGSSIKPTSLLCLPRGDSEDVKGGLPNFQHPSDHLPIGADFLVVNS